MNSIEIKHIKKGMYVMLKGRPCRIIEYSISKTGKHGGMKVSATGTDVLNSNKIIVMMAGHKEVFEFKLERHCSQLTNIDGDSLSYFSDDIEKQIRLNSESELYKNINGLFMNNKSVSIVIIKAPIEVSENKYDYEEMVEDFKEE